MGNVIPAHALARKAKEVHVLMFGRFITLTKYLLTLISLKKNKKHKSEERGNFLQPKDGKFCIIDKESPTMPTINLQSNKNKKV